MSTPLTIQLRDHSDYALITLTGAIDGHSFVELQDFLDDAVTQHSNLIFDLKELNYVASAGIGVFIALQQRCEKANGDLLLCNPQPMVREVFGILGLENIFKIKHSLAEAQASFTA